MGFYIDAAGNGDGFLFSHGHYSTIDYPNAGTGLYEGTFGFGINELGDTVGQYTDSAGVNHGFLRTAG